MICHENIKNKTISFIPATKNQWLFAAELFSALRFLKNICVKNLNNPINLYKTHLTLTIACRQKKFKAKKSHHHQSKLSPSIKNCVTHTNHFHWPPTLVQNLQVYSFPPNLNTNPYHFPPPHKACMQALSHQTVLCQFMASVLLWLVLVRILAPFSQLSWGG